MYPGNRETEAMKDLKMLPVLVAAAALITVPPAHGALLAYDPFATGGSDYTVGPIAGQNPTTLGFTGAWAKYDGGGDASVAATGLTDSRLSPPGSGGSMDAGGLARTHRAFSTTYGTDGTTLWASYLMAAPSYTASTWRGVAFGNGPGTSPGEYVLDIAWDGYGGLPGSGIGANMMILFNRPDWTGTGTSYTPTAGATNLMLLKFAFGAGDSDSVTLWINPADVSSEAALGAGWTLAGHDFAFNRLWIEDNAGGAATTCDEIRIGDTLGDALGDPDGPGLAITDVRFDAATRTAEFTWNSRSGATYKVDYSADGKSWIEFDDSYASAGETTTYSDASIPAEVTRRLYRVGRN